MSKESGGLQQVQSENKEQNLAATEEERTGSGAAGLRCQQFPTGGPCLRTLS